MPTMGPDVARCTGAGGDTLAAAEAVAREGELVVVRRGSGAAGEGTLGAGAARAAGAEVPIIPAERSTGGAGTRLGSALVAALGALGALDAAAGAGAAAGGAAALPNPPAPAPAPAPAGGGDDTLGLDALDEGSDGVLPALLVPLLAAVLLL